MDCSKTENYLKEKDRLCKLTEKCDNCPLGCRNNGMDLTCDKLQVTCPRTAIELVQKWSDEHPQETILSDFLKKYPNTPLNAYGTPENVCPCDLGLEDMHEYCEGIECLYCWNQPLKERDLC